jgi:outer membrane murein-binding lipoprotein Lpp
MAKATPTGQCSICFKKPGTFICGGCLQNFCHNDLTKHVQNLGKELDGIENDHDEFRQILNDQKNDSTKRSLIQEIDKWEEDSINNIKQTAEECRQELINYTNKFIIKIENKLDDLAKELKQTREEHEFNEIHLNRFKQNLNKLKQELDKPSSVSIQQESSKFINKIFVISPCDKGNKILFT